MCVFARAQSIFMWCVAFVDVDYVESPFYAVRTGAY